MAWHQTGTKSLHKPWSPTTFDITRPEWVYWCYNLNIISQDYLIPFGLVYANDIIVHHITVAFHEYHGTSNPGKLTVCSTSYYCQQQIKHQSFTSLILCEGKSLITDGFPHKGSVMWKAFPCHNLIMKCIIFKFCHQYSGAPLADSLFVIHYRRLGLVAIQSKVPLELENGISGRLFLLCVSSTPLRYCSLCIVDEGCVIRRTSLDLVH